MGGAVGRALGGPGGLGGPLTPCSCAWAEPGVLRHGDRDPQCGQVLTHQRAQETAPQERYRLSCCEKRGTTLPRGPRQNSHSQSLTALGVVSAPKGPS